MSAPPIVIVGSGLAGYTLAREIRKTDTDTPITVITADDGVSYSKPMLSNAFAQNKAPRDLVQKTADVMADTLDITVKTFTRVTAIDRAAKRLRLLVPSGEDTQAYGRLVLATGAQPRGIDIPGMDIAPVDTVNSLADYTRWRHGLNDGDRILIIGAGLIGMEFANDMVLAGYGVTVVEPANRPLGRLLPEPLAPVMIDAFTRAGITLELGQTVQRIEQDGGSSIAVLDNDRRVPFDRALVAIGLQPDIRLARQAGITTGHGIKTDAFLATSDADIFALGDGAETPAGVLPFVLPLMAAARALAKTLTGTPTALTLPALPVAVKTPALPTVVCPPAPNAEGTWTLEGEGADRRALFTAPDGALLGFVLTGTCTSERMTLSKQVPDLLSPPPDLAA